MVQKLTALDPQLIWIFKGFFLQISLRLRQMLNSVFCSKHNQCSCKMTRIGSNKIELKVREYVKENWGVPFILGFMLLLIVAAVSLTVGLPSLADTIAVYAYYALVAGVFLQLASFLKYRGKSDDKVAV